MWKRYNWGGWSNKYYICFECYRCRGVPWVSMQQKLLLLLPLSSQSYRIVMKYVFKENDVHTDARWRGLLKSRSVKNIVVRMEQNIRTEQDNRLDPRLKKVPLSDDNKCDVRGTARSEIKLWEAPLWSLPRYAEYYCYIIKSNSDV